MSDVASPTHVVPVQSGKDTAAITPQWFVNKSEYQPHLATYRPLINGEEAFGEVYRAIAAAKKTVCIICWGFQPSMYFVRDATHEPIGELLIKKAREGIVVRVLCWACNLLGDVPLTGLAVGEPNTPGRWRPGFYKDKPQSATDAQYSYDIQWYTLFDRQWSSSERAGKVLGQKIKARLDSEFGAVYPNLQFYSRSYSKGDMAGLRLVNYLDKGLSLTTKLTLTFTPSHHQKMVVVDHEDPQAAVGFVMGHNMLDGYWDTPEHSGTPRRPDCGRNGGSPLHDYSSRVTGPIIGDLFRNFADAWQRETKQALRMPAFDSYPLRGDDGRAICQILRTQPQYGKEDIKACYLQAVSNATQYILIENQYFRWPPLADKIKESAAKMTQWGRSPEKHGSLYLFVISNTSDAGMGSGTVNTYRMLESLGRGDRLPEVTRDQRLEAIDRELKSVEKQMKPLVREKDALDSQARLLQGLPAPGLTERYAPINEKLGPLEARKRELEEQKARLEPKSWRERTFGSDRTPEAIKASNVPGLKVHVATLVAPDTKAGEEWQEVYIHAKLMLIDDTFMTAGSANINTRSMQVDSEMNIAHHRPEITAPLRARQWEKYTAGQVPSGMPLDEAFAKWGKIIDMNSKAKAKRQQPLAQLAEFLRTSDKISNSD